MSAVASAAAVLNIFAPPIEVEVTERMPACPWAAAPTEILNSPGAFTGSRASVAVTRTGFPAANVISRFAPLGSLKPAFAPSRGSSMVAVMQVGSSPDSPLAVGSMHSIRTEYAGSAPRWPLAGRAGTLVSTTRFTPPPPVRTAR